MRKRVTFGQRIPFSLPFLTTRPHLCDVMGAKFVDQIVESLLVGLVVDFWELFHCTDKLFVQWGIAGDSVTVKQTSLEQENKCFARHLGTIRSSFPPPVVFTGYTLACEAKLVTLGFPHGVFSHFRLSASEHHRAALSGQLHVQVGLPVVFHRRAAGAEQSLAGSVESAGHLHAAGVRCPPVHHRQGDALLLVLQVGVDAERAGLVLASPLIHVDHKGAFPFQFGDVEAFPGQRGARC